MIEYIKGELTDLTPAMATVEAAGVGYGLNISLTTFSAIQGKKEVKLYVHESLVAGGRDDNFTLYGFYSKQERELYRLLITVSGVGAKSAIAMLSSIETSEFAIAVVSDDVNTLKKLPGVGAKTAQRIILELKDKIKKEQTISELAEATSDKQIQINVQNKNANLEEMKTALQVLGYSRKDIETVSTKIRGDGLKLEELIKEALKILSN